MLRFFEKVTGLRMNHNFIRPGGVAADLPDGWRSDVLRLLELIPPRLEEYDTLMTANQAICRAAETAGCRWFIVEQDTCPGDPIDSLRQSFAYLTSHIAER